MTKRRATRVATLIGLIAWISCGVAGAQTAASMTVVGTDVRDVWTAYRDDGSFTLRLIARNPDGFLTSNVEWPVEQAQPPASFDSLRFNVLPGASARAEDALNSCKQQALLAQAKSAHYRLVISFYVADGTLDAAVTGSQVEANLGEPDFRLVCALRRVAWE